MSEATNLPTGQVDVNADLAKAVSEATSPEAISAAVRAEFARQVEAKIKEQTNTTDDAAKVAADAAAAKAAVDAAAAAAEAAKTAIPTLVTRVENIAGKDIEFSGKDDAEIDRLVLNAFKIAYAVRETPAAVVVDPAVEAAKAAEAAATQAAARAELELKFKRGEIGTAEYLEQSGAVAEYLEKQGIPLADLKASVERERGTHYVQSWEDATAEFFKTPLGATWPGGEQNKNMIGMKLAELGLTDATDKVAALAQAYENMKATKMIFPPDPKPGTVVVDPAAGGDAAAQAAAAAAAATAAQNAAAAAVKAAEDAKKPKPQGSSALFGASSGTGATNDGKTVPADAVIEIPKDMTPAEILEAWKQAQIKAGVSPNAAFDSIYAAKK